MKPITAYTRIRKVISKRSSGAKPPINYEDKEFIKFLMPKDKYIYFGNYAVCGTVGIPEGLGTEEDPYLISNLEELIWVSEHPDKWDRWYKQIADIDASATWTMNSISGGYNGFRPIGIAFDDCWCGHYDGQGHSISNIYINWGSNEFAGTGLFGVIIADRNRFKEGNEQKIEIKGIKLINATIIGGYNTGGIVGNVTCEQGESYTGYATISECYVSGNISGTIIVGGVIGRLAGISNRIFRCGANVNIKNITSGVSASRRFGGLIGSTSCNIEDCYSMSTIDITLTPLQMLTGSKAGGLTGSIGYFNSSGWCKRSFSTGRIYINGNLVTDSGWASSDSSISTSSPSTNNYWDGESSGASSSGASNKCTRLTTLEAKNRLSFATYSFKPLGGSGTWNIGNSRNNLYPYLDWEYPDDPGYEVGVELETLACTDVTLTTCTGNGKITALGTPATQHGHCWSTSPDPTIADSKTELGAKSTTGEFTSNITGLTEGETYYVRAYVTSGDTYYGDSVTVTMYTIPVAVQPSGSGTISDPYLIASLGNLIWIADPNGAVSYINRMKAHYKQTSSIDAYSTRFMDSGAGFIPIGTRISGTLRPFNGEYLGNGKTISSIYINRPTANDPIGIFGSTDVGVDTTLYKKRVSDLTVVDANITGMNSVGFIGSCVQSDLLYVSVSGVINGSDSVGGIAGRSSYFSVITNCYSTCDVNGANGVGGIAGSPTTTEINNSYSIGTVKGTTNVGGFVGNATGTSGISNCYSKGDVYRLSGTSTILGGFVGGVAVSTPLTKCYSIGKVYYGSTLQTDRGFSGSSAGSYTNCLWDMDASGSSTTLGTATGLTTANIKTQSVLEGYGFSFLSDWWIESGVNDGYAYLKWENLARLNSLIDVPGGIMTIWSQTRTISNLKVSKYQIQQGEYFNITGKNPSSAKASRRFPVTNVSFYDILVYCNMRSIAENKTPCYSISGSTNPADWGTIPTTDNATWNAVTTDTNANGYRLPTNFEWEYIARGGQSSLGYTYSGSNTIGEVAWYTSNSGSAIKEVGLKNSNELGTFDMSGNVWEWSNTFEGSQIYIRGGGYNSSTTNCRSVAYTTVDTFSADVNRGFRVVTKGD